MNKEYLKKTGEELQEYLRFRRRGIKLPIKKGKGSEYNRSKEKKKLLTNMKMCDIIVKQ